MPRRTDPRLPAMAAVVGAVVLYVTLPQKLTVGSVWILPVLEGILLILLVATSPYREREHRTVRIGFLVSIGLLNAANIVSLGLLTHELLHRAHLAGSQLFFAAVQIYVTNIIVFTLWFWELDRGGPVAREHRLSRYPDFQFVQMLSPNLAAPAWVPGFVDYLYLAFTNATAFSPTDTMPLTPRAKALMTVEATVALMTVALVAGRAVNILS